jgi:hypothetical protein
LAAILVAWYGIRWMLGGNDSDRMLGLAKLLLIFSSLPRAMTPGNRGATGNHHPQHTVRLDDTDAVDRDFVERLRLR